MRWVRRILVGLLVLAVVIAFLGFFLVPGQGCVGDHRRWFRRDRVQQLGGGRLAHRIRPSHPGQRLSPCYTDAFIWYQNALHCTDPTDACPYRVIGFSFAGTPGVVLGHNEHLAWGVTNQSADTEDQFIEKVNPDNPAQYEYQGEWVDMEVRPETIAVAGGEDIDYDVMVTRHGPVISDTYLGSALFEGSALELPDAYVVSLAWQTLQPSTLLEAIIGMNRARSHEEFRAALSKWDSRGRA